MSNSGYLHKYCLNNSTLYMEKWLHYFDIYERHFSRFRGKAPVILEIGVMGGGSLSMWRDYFGEGCQIVGLDINPACEAFNDPDNNIDVFIGSQDDATVIDAILEKYPRIDIVLDDGSHINRHMVKTFELLYDKIHHNGVYMVEDTHACYWESHEGGLKKGGSFMEFTKDKLDEINAIHIRENYNPTIFTAITDYLACYDSVVVFEKRLQSVRQPIRTSPMLTSRK